jgi:hypothetical protein
MMNLRDVIKVVDQLSPEELRELRDYINQREAQTSSEPVLSPEERIRRLDEAAKAIREGLTEEEWKQIENDMNAEYIEPWDEAEWSD